MSLKIEFVEKASKPGANISALCREYGVSRPAGYKWLRRYKLEGYEGLDERSRRPKSSPLASAEELVLAVIETREAHPRWGPQKIKQFLARRFRENTPSRSTIARVLSRFGKVRQRRSYKRLSIVERAPNIVAKAPNEIWTTDFKGWWNARDGRRCDPLTVRDAYSRFVFSVRLLENGPRQDEVRAVFEGLFKKYGLPSAMQCDNGSPFICTRARGGLTQLSAWWIALGIRVVRSRLGCPQDNGGHERMHRDISEDVQAVPAESLRAAQLACDRWRQEFNHVRPHDALQGKTPAELYRPSARRGLRLSRHLYPSTWLVRVPAWNGFISVDDQKIPTSRSLAGHPVALEPLAGMRYRLWFRDVDLGEVEVAHRLVIDEVTANFMQRRSLGT